MSLCSKGTYVRALAADLGEALGCGAHLAALRRTATGGFDIRDAHTLDALAAMETAGARRLPAAGVVAARRACRRCDVERRDGKRASCRAPPSLRRRRPTGSWRCTATAALLGIADAAGGEARPRRVIAGGQPAA